MPEFWRKLYQRMANRGPSRFKKIVVGIVGFTVLLIGIALLVLPGPAFLVIPAGLAILATEFLWARRWLKKIKSMVTGRSSNDTEAPSQSPPEDNPAGKGSRDTDRFKAEPR